MPKLRPETLVERRQLLVDAAWQCAALRGFRDLTVDDVCAAAGVSKGAFYGYFGHKQDLLLALLQDDAAALDAELERITDASSSGVQRLRLFAEAMLVRRRGCGTGAGARRSLGRSPHRGGRARALGDDDAATPGARALMDRGGVASGELVDVPANALASILLALTDGLMLHRALDPDAFRWRNIRRAIDAMLAGIEAT